MRICPHLIVPLLPTLALAAEPVKFERVVIDADFPGGYQVEVADVDGDGKPDVVGVGGGTCAWYQNPTWKKRVISTPKQTPDIISSATVDLDGDGRAEVAIAHDFAMNEPKRGKLTLAIPGKSVDDPWTFKFISDFPSIHRLRWARLFGPEKPELVVAPIFGRDARPPTFQEEPATIVVFYVGLEPKAGVWTRRALGGGHVLHAIEARVDPKKVGDPLVLAACDEGVLAVMATTGADGKPGSANQLLFPTPAAPPGKRGCSEVHLGRLADGRRILATVEPWHGSTVAVRYDLDPKIRNLVLSPGREVLDDTLDDGHALWLADVDGDGSDEVFAGHRGKDYRVSMYRHDGKTWARTVLDREVAAQDLRGGDLDGDGVPDVVAIGGKTHNVVWYRPIRSAK